MTETILEPGTRRRDHDPTGRVGRRLSGLSRRPASGLGNHRGRLPGPDRDDGRGESARRAGPRRVPARRRGGRDVVRLPGTDRGSSLPVLATDRGRAGLSVARAWATGSSSSSAILPVPKGSTSSPGRSTRSRRAMPISTWPDWVRRPAVTSTTCTASGPTALNAGRADRSPDRRVGHEGGIG